MEARSRIIRFPREVVVALAAVLLILAAMAGGYVIRLATAPSGATPSTGAATVQLAPPVNEAPQVPCVVQRGYAC